MAKRVKNEDQEPGDGHGVSAFRGNGYDPAAVQGFVDRVENLYADLATAKSEFMNQARLIHGDVKEVLKEAKNAGIPKKSLKGLIKTRKLQHDLEDVRNELEGDDQDSYDRLCLALGTFAETPLGGAAAERAAA